MAESQTSSEVGERSDSSSEGERRWILSQVLLNVGLSGRGSRTRRARDPRSALAESSAQDTDAPRRGRREIFSTDEFLIEVVGEGEDDEDGEYMSSEETEDGDGADEVLRGLSEEGTCCENSASLETKGVEAPVAALMDHPLGELTRLYTAASWGSRKLGRVGYSSSSIVNTHFMLQGRETNISGNGRFSRAEACHLSQRFIPRDGPTIIDNMNSRAYIGQFSEDGRMFIGAYQDRRIRLYNVEDGWTLRKDIIARNLRWTITDTALSPDQRFLVYASITPVVHLVNVGSNSGGVESLANITDIHEGLDFSEGGRDRVRDRAFGLWSLQFSSDGREIVAGSNDESLYVYDVEANKRTLKVRAHDDDVNAVAFADDTSQLLFSGSDDRLCKVWDRRVLGRKSDPVGVLVGHVEGVTHISSKGDGHHLISNSKDQTIKLWDMRKMIDERAFKRLPHARLPRYNWDYRWMDYPGRANNFKHPHDQSLMTYRNHSVLQTLIRAYFSPMHSTGQRYIYTGSSDGKVYIYDLVSGAEVAKLSHHCNPVRDCSWHPTLPMLASVSWDGQLARWDYLHGEKPSDFRKTKLPSFPLASDSYIFDSD